MSKSSRLLTLFEQRGWGTKLHRSADPEILRMRNDLMDLTNFLPEGSKYSQRAWHIKNDMYEVPLCKECGKDTTFNVGSLKYNTFCSTKCSTKNNETQEKLIGTMQDRYGVDNPMYDESFKRKVAETNLERYGVDNPFKSDDIRERIRETVKEKYGVDEILSSRDIRRKIIETNLERYGSPTPKIKKKTKQTSPKKNGERKRQLDMILNKQIRLTPTHIHKDAALSKIIYFLEEQEIAFESDVNELDIYIPDHNLAIEYCGLYWHSDKQLSKYYHKMKTDLCREKGIRLIHIFEDEWLEKEELIKEKILNILGKSTKERVYARKTKIVEVDTKTKSEFFDQNHIQGNGPTSINYGLEYNGELVAVLGFIKQKDHFALNRYATSKNVVGGFTKLLKHFEKEYNNPSILTFADLRWSEGDLYYNTGFVLDKEIPPDYFWCKGSKRWHKFNWRHVGMKQKLENYDPTLSETQNMQNHGFYRIWDCGKMRFVKNSEQA